MAYEKSKGLLSVATSYSGGGYHYEKIDRFIGKQDIEITPDQMQDLDSYVNTKGHLDRTVLEHTRSKIEFNTKYLLYSEKCELIRILRTGTRQHGCSTSERKVRLRYYDDWEDDYKYGFFYLPDVTFTYGGTYRGQPEYQPTRIAFIEY